MTGEPGIGKTRLAKEAVREAEATGMLSAWGRAIDDDGSPPFWPFRLVTQSLAGGSDDPWPQLVATERSFEAPWSESRAQEQFMLFEAVTSHLVAAAGDTGLLVVLDDLQWADASSLRLLGHLTRSLPTAPIAVIGTYRDTETQNRQGFQRMLGDVVGEPETARLRLVGLSEPEVAEQLAAVNGSPVSRDVAAAVSSRSNGNPFFVGELAGLLRHTGRPEDVGQALPDGVRDVVRGLLARLGDSTRTVVTTAAILGETADPTGLAHVLKQDPADVFTALDEAAAAGVLSGERWEFVHDLVRDAARTEVPNSARLAAHRRMAEYLQRQPHAEAMSAELAHHWLESLPLGDASQAAWWAERAARDASREYGWDEAAELYQRAAQVTGDPAHRGELLVECATALRHAYHMQSAHESVRAAAQLARSLADGQLLARAALVMEGVNDLTWSAESRTLCEEALALLPDEVSPLRARLLAQLSVDHLMLGYSTPGISTSGELSRAALAMAERLSDKAALRSALHARQMACNGPDGVHERLTLGDRFIARGINDGDDIAEMWGRLWRFDALIQLGDLDGAEGVVGPLTLVANRLRLPLASWHLLCCRGAIAFARGRLDEARGYGEQALALARRGDHEGGLLPSQGFLALLGALTGFESETDTRILDGWEHIRPLRGLLALVHWHAGREEEARLAYATAPSIDELPGFLLMSAGSGMIELADAFHDEEVLDAAYRKLAPYADLFCCGGGGVIATTGSAHGPLGVAAVALRRIDEGIRHLRRAIAVNERAGAPPFVATARYDLARALARRHRAGDRDEAAALAAQAATAARELGLLPLRNRSEQLVATLAGAAPGPLTPREREIAELVSQGLTNRQIAATARISERTAENHVQHILAKLGFNTRAQIAAWVAGGQHGGRQSLGPLRGFGQTSLS